MSRMSSLSRTSSRSLTRLANRTGSAPGLVGALVLLQLCVLRAVASAATGRTFLFGRELHWDCWFKQRTGFPCPTCGMTRSVLLTLHGQPGAAMQLNPAGLLLVCGLILFSLSMLFLMLYRQRRTSLDAGLLHRRLRLASSAYGALFIAVLILHWLAELIAR